MLLFGVVTYAAGRLGKNRFAVRDMSIASASTAAGRRRSCMKSGRESHYLHARVRGGRPRTLLCGHRRAGRKGTGTARLGHATISASRDEPLTFGAWCDREYGFEYDAVRARKGLARYPRCRMNRLSGCIIRTIFPGGCRLLPRQYTEFGITSAPVYQQFIDDPARFQFISRPDKTAELWRNFHPYNNRGIAPVF
ncbi:glucose-6-phosphate isomerase [Raoultella planticola]|nr:glucose-6-phosphate isomerase [Raoultella planticola]